MSKLPSFLAPTSNPTRITSPPGGSFLITFSYDPCPPLLPKQEWALKHLLNKFPHLKSKEVVCENPGSGWFHFNEAMAILASVKRWLNR